MLPRLSLIALLGAAAALTGPPARAAGNAEIVDDAFIGAPGECQVETWVTRLSRRSGAATVSPACTLRALPALQLGALTSTSWQPGPEDTTIGPIAKVALGSVGALGFAVDGEADWSIDTGRLETASVIVPVSLTLSEAVTLSLNAGWLWRRDGGHNAAFYGAQVEWHAADRWTLVAEFFGDSRSDPGLQTGVRWTPRPWLDLEALAGYKVDGEADLGLTLGVTVRF
ncbi:MAG: hypothetical protein GC201_17195 [Alphaproteobacteria bacterium]|nr:hypothetical protein [Alphaproteobacteria bacterium]